MPLSYHNQALLIASYIALLLTAATHLANASQNIVYGQYRKSTTNNENYYKNLLPTTTYIFITALLMLIYIAVSTVSMFRKKQNVWLSMLAWYLCLLVTVFNFAVGVNTANQYLLIDTILQYYKITLKGIDDSFLVYFRLILTDAVISFVLGLPSSLVLLRGESYKRALMGVEEEERRRKEVEMGRKEYRIEQVLVIDEQSSKQGQSSQ